MRFNKVIFWCEFPNEVDWEIFNKIFKIKSDIYIASKTKKEFLKWKSKIKNEYVKNIGAWPVLTKEEGYWFSSYSSKKSIDRLFEFKGIKMKIDLEPPLLVNYGWLKMVYAYSKLLLFKKAKNHNYINKKILELSKNTEIILSGFPFPKWFSSIYGDRQMNPKNTKRNFFIYRTLIPKILRPILKIYFKYFIKKSINKFGNKNLFFAVGCIGHGILGNEPTYKNINEFEKDLDFLLNNNIKNLVIFDLAGIMNRKNPEDWFEIIKKYII